MPIPAAIADPVTGRLLWVNQDLAAMYGVEDPHSMRGRLMFEFVQPSQLSRLLADLAKVVAGQSPPPHTYQLKRANGERAAGQASAVAMVYHRKPAVLIFLADVSERETMVRELTESEERYRLLLETMPSGVAVVDHEDLIVYANGALVRALGFGADSELLGTSMYEHFPEEHRAEVRKTRKRNMSSGEGLPAELLTLVCSDGSHLEVSCSTTVIRWGGRIATQTVMHGISHAARTNGLT